MAISFVGSSNVANGLAAGTSAVVPRPVGVVDGDQLLAFISIGTTGAIAAPVGWVEVPLAVNTAPNLQNRIYSKVASSEPASWTWTFASSAYVGIAHATRGVGGIVAAQQSDDGLSLLVHTTPTLPAPVNSWLVSSFTGRNLLALGWSAPAGDVERQDVIGGLLVLLNVNHAVDDTNGPVVAGSYSKTAATLIAVRALDALVVLAPTLDPVVLGVLKSPVSFGDVRVQNGLLLGAVPSPVGFGSLSVSHTLTLTDILSPVTFGLLDIQLGIDLQPVLSPDIYGLFGVDAELTLQAQLTPVTLDPLVLELEAILGSHPVPLDLEPVTISLELVLDHIDSPVIIADDFILLEEHSIMIWPPLPIPIIAGSGGILSVFRTLLVDEPEPMVAIPADFGTVYVYATVPYGGSCCAT